MKSVEPAHFASTVAERVMVNFWPFGSVPVVVVFMQAAGMVIPDLS